MTAIAKPKRKPIGFAHFTVDFDGLTRIVRDFWAEHNFERALSVLIKSHIPEATAHDIIRGKKRMAQDPKGRKGIDGIVVADDWTPNLNHCQHGVYPDPLDLPKLAADGVSSTAELKRIAEERWENAHSVIMTQLREAIDENKWDELQELFDAYDLLPAPVRSKHPLPYNRTYLLDVAARAKREKERRAKGLPSDDPAQLFIDRQLALDKRPTPRPENPPKSGNGWLLPSGKFYPCENPMEHIWLAGRLGKEEHNAEASGWVKCATGLTGVHVFSKTTPTQAQVNALYKWIEADKARISAVQRWFEQWKEELR